LVLGGSVDRRSRLGALARAAASAAFAAAAATEVHPSAPSYYRTSGLRVHSHVPWGNRHVYIALVLLLILLVLLVLPVLLVVLLAPIVLTTSTTSRTASTNITRSLQWQSWKLLVDRTVVLPLVLLVIYKYLDIVRCRLVLYKVLQPFRSCGIP
jgi:hypothetical protein